MHRRARRGEEVELAPCTVTVHELTLLDVDLPRIRFFVRCSSGTYIRSIARDIGGTLGVGGHLTRLRRTRVGAFTVERALSVEELGDAAMVATRALTLLEAVAHLDAVEVIESDAASLALGQAVRFEGRELESPVAVSLGGRLVAIAEGREGMLRPKKVFHS